MLLQKRRFSKPSQVVRHPTQACLVSLPVVRSSHHSTPIQKVPLGDNRIQKNCRSPRTTNLFLSCKSAPQTTSSQKQTLSNLASRFFSQKLCANYTLATSKPASLAQPFAKKFFCTSFHSPTKSSPWPVSVGILFPSARPRLQISQRKVIAPLSSTFSSLVQFNYHTQFLKINQPNHDSPSSLSSFTHHRLVSTLKTPLTHNFEKSSLLSHRLFSTNTTTIYALLLEELKNGQTQKPVDPEQATEKQNRLSFRLNRALMGHMQRNEIEAADGVLQNLVRMGLPIEYKFCERLLENFIEKQRWDLIFDLFELLLKTPGAEISVKFLHLGLDFHGKNSRHDKFGQIIDEFQKRGLKKTVVTYNIVIKHLCSKGYLDQAAILWEEMISVGILPNSRTAVSILNGLLVARYYQDFDRFWTDLESSPSLSHCLQHPASIALRLSWFRKLDRFAEMETFFQNLRDDQVDPGCFREMLRMYGSRGSDLDKIPPWFMTRWEAQCRAANLNMARELNKSFKNPYQREE